MWWKSHFWPRWKFLHEKSQNFFLNPSCSYARKSSGNHSANFSSSCFSLTNYHCDTDSHCSTFPWLQLAARNQGQGLLGAMRHGCGDKIYLKKNAGLLVKKSAHTQKKTGFPISELTWTNRIMPGNCPPYFRARFDVFLVVTMVEFHRFDSLCCSTWCSTCSTDPPSKRGFNR